MIHEQDEPGKGEEAKSHASVQLLLFSIIFLRSCRIWR